MEYKVFIQISLFSLYFLVAICEFKLLELDVTFLVTFILAIFAISISIFFFVKSNEIFISIKESLKGIEKGVEDIRSGDIGQVMKLSKEMKPPRMEKFKKNRPVRKLDKK